LNCLLDTNVFLWAASSLEKLSEPALAAFTPENTLWLSLASAWEMAIKGDKLKLPAAAIEYVEDRAARLRIGLLPIRMRHLRQGPSCPAGRGRIAGPGRGVGPDQRRSGSGALSGFGHLVAPAGLSATAG